MNLFELATVSSPLGAVLGGGLALRAVPTVSPTTWTWVAIGGVLSLLVPWILARVLIGRHDRNPDAPTWRMAGSCGIVILSPLIAAAVTYGWGRLVA